MTLPYRLISAVSLAGGYLLSSGRIPKLPQLGFLATFTAIWAAQFLIWFVWAAILYPKLLSPLRGLPEPTGNSWLMGQLPKIRSLPTGEPMIEWINSIPNNGVIRYLGMFNQERLLIASPKALAEVLVTKNYDFAKPPQFRDTLGHILGLGILIAEGDEHKMQRKNLLPAFAFRHIKDLYPVFWDKSREGVQAMTQQILQDAAGTTDAKNTSVIEVNSWASRITLDIIGLAGMGRDFGAIEDPHNELSEAYRKIFQPNRQEFILGMIGQFISPRVLNWLPIQRNRDLQEARRLIQATCTDLIKEKKQKLARKELADVDILSVALESGGFSDENLVDQLRTFLAAGHETTASSMTFAAYLLAKHTEVQTRLRAEVREHLPPISSVDDDSRAVSSLDIDRMPYLNAVCNEVLRYFAPAPLTLRQAVCDTSIQGQFVPKGTRIMLVPWAINRSESLWGQDASEFNPDRWLPKSEKDKHAASGGATSNYAFLTFLHGPRSCIGQSFAKAEFACLLASWVGRFNMELANKEEMDETKLDIKSNITARPAKGMYIKVTVLDGW